MMGIEHGANRARFSRRCASRTGHGGRQAARVARHIAHTAPNAAPAARRVGFEARPGFTLLELIVSMIVLSIVIGTTLSFMSAQRNAFGTGAARAEVLRNLHHAVSMLERDLRTTGTNLARGQPFIVYGDDDVIAVNADYASNLADDPAAVYYDPDAPNEVVAALTAATPVTIPGTAFDYPDTTYTYIGGQPSLAELLIFFFAPDSTTPDTSDYVLYRQVNAQPPEVVARGLYRWGDRPFFEFLALTNPSGTAGTIAPISAANLPLAHTARTHLAPDDTLPASLIDQVRGVRVNVAASARGSGGSRSVSTVIRFPNAGLQTEQTCGSPPLALRLVNGAGFIANGIPQVVLTWDPSEDEGSGERDVIRYVIWRRVWGETQPPEPYTSIPSGGQEYEFIDRNVVPGTTYAYRVAAQDCTPNLSAPFEVVVTVPSVP